MRHDRNGLQVFSLRFEPEFPERSDFCSGILIVSGEQMDRASLSKKLSLVVILANMALGPSPAWAKDEPEGKSETDYVLTKEQWDTNRKDNREKACSDSLKEANKAKAKFINACKDGGATLGTCSEILDNCIENAEVEEILTPENILSNALGVQAAGPGGARENKCSKYSYTDYQTELRDLKREKKELEVEIQELQKEKIDAEKDISKRKAELQKELAEGQKAKAKAEMEAKEEERNMERARQDQEAKLKKQMRELQTQILNAQNTKAIMTASRAGEIDKYKVELMKCEVEADKVLKSLNSNTSSSLAKRAVVAGNLKQAGLAKGNKNKAKATLMKGCVSEVTARRNAEAVAFQNKMKEKDEEISNAQAEMQETQKSLQMLAQQFAQAAQDRAQAKSQEMAAYQQELKARSDEFNSLQSEYVQTQARIAKALQEANAALVQASNELGSHQKEKPVPKGGSKSLREQMQEAQAEYVATSCSVLCKEVPILETECEKIENNTKSIRKKMDSEGASGSK